MFGSQGLLVGAIKQRKLQNRGADLFAEGGEIAETASQAVQMILHEDPDLMVVLFNETDSTAHKYGTSGPQIQAVVEQIDDALGQILDAYRQRGHAEALNVVLVGDHGMTEVHTNLTSTLSDVLDAVGIPYENAAVNIGPFREDTKLVYNLASGSAEIYFRKPLTQAEYDALIAGLEGITGVARVYTVPFPVSWTVKMKKKQKETQDILSYHTQAAGCSDKARAKASGGRQPIEECGRTGL